jgi:hypothetical protein
VGTVGKIYQSDPIEGVSEEGFIPASWANRKCSGRAGWRRPGACGS